MSVKVDFLKVLKQQYDVKYWSISDFLYLGGFVVQFLSNFKSQFNIPALAKGGGEGYVWGHSLQTGPPCKIQRQIFNLSNLTSLLMYLLKSSVFCWNLASDLQFSQFTFVSCGLQASRTSQEHVPFRFVQQTPVWADVGYGTPVSRWLDCCYQNLSVTVLLHLGLYDFILKKSLW